MDGTEFARAARKEERDTHRLRVPIVAVTASAMQEELDACLAAGMDDSLTKPSNINLLRECLGNWLGRQRVVHQKSATARHSTV